MSSGFAISAFLPSIVSSSLFSTRRANRGANALSNDPIVGVMNGNIATGQIYNAAKGAAEIAKETSVKMNSRISSAEESIKNLSKGDKLLSGAGKVVQFTADHINPIIVATAGVHVLTSDDKESTFCQEACALPTMFAFESAAKNLLGIPNIKKVNGKRVSIPRTALYKKNPFLKKQAEAFSDYCSTKQFLGKFTKYLPTALKGFGLVCASIAGYQLGLSFANNVLLNNKNNENKEKKDN